MLGKEPYKHDKDLVATKLSIMATRRTNKQSNINFRKKIKNTTFLFLSIANLLGFRSRDRSRKNNRSRLNALLNERSVNATISKVNKPLLTTIAPKEIFFRES